VKSAHISAADLAAGVRTRPDLLILT